MNDPTPQHRNAMVPAVNLEVVTTEELIDEMIRRHDSLIYAGFPKGTKKPMLSMRASGGYVTCRGLALEIGDYVKESRPQIIDGPPPEGA